MQDPPLSLRFVYLKCHFHNVKPAHVPSQTISRGDAKVDLGNFNTDETWIHRVSDPKNFLLRKEIGLGGADVVFKSDQEPALKHLLNNMAIAEERLNDNLSLVIGLPWKHNAEHEVGEEVRLDVNAPEPSSNPVGSPFGS